MHMTKDEYIHWKETRDPEGRWKMEDCLAADQLIKTTALENANKWCEEYIREPALSLFKTFISVHFGSVEVDNFLQQIKAYPDWL